MTLLCVSACCRFIPTFALLRWPTVPGFPFLGNNFFNKVGDCFSAHVVSNVDQDSEFALLRSFAPTAPEFLLRSLIRLFDDLRTSVDSGTLHYPYSMRELVQVAKHVEKFPRDSLAKVLGNVFALDFANPSVAPFVRDILLKHAIPLDLGWSGTVSRATWASIADRRHETVWTFGDSASVQQLRHARPPHSVQRPWKWRRDHEVQLKGRTEARVSMFTELLFEFSLPPKTQIADCVQTINGQVHVACVSPMHVLSFDANFRQFCMFDLAIHLPYHRSLPMRPRLFASNPFYLVLFLPHLPCVLGSRFGGFFCAAASHSVNRCAGRRRVVFQRDYRAGRGQYSQRGQVHVGCSIRARVVAVCLLE
jgi:hypothetical protein